MFLWETNLCAQNLVQFLPEENLPPGELPKVLREQGGGEVLQAVLGRAPVVAAGAVVVPERDLFVQKEKFELCIFLFLFMYQSVVWVPDLEHRPPLHAGDVGHAEADVLGPPF